MSGAVIQFDQTTISRMTAAINQLSADMANPNTSPATISADVAAYYNFQVLVRGYAQLAENVANNIGFNGNVANTNIENFYGSANFSTFRAQVAASLAIQDWSVIQQGNYQIPTIAQDADEHALVFRTLGIPITYWSGAAFAAENVNWIGPTATSAELQGNPSQYFTGLTNSQLGLSQANLGLAVGQNILDLPFDPVSRAQFAVDMGIFGSLVEQELTNLAQPIAQYLTSAGFTSTLIGSIQDINIKYDQLQAFIGANVPASSIPPTLMLGLSSTGSLVSDTINRSDGTSQVTTYNSDGSTTTTSYAGANGTGTVTKVDHENANGTSQITTYDANGNSITTDYTGLNGTGSITKIDQENGDGTSRITTYGPNGTTTTDYSGPNGTGSQGSQTITINNGTVTATVQFGPTQLDFPAVRVNSKTSYFLSTVVNYVSGNFKIGSVSVGENSSLIYASAFHPQPFARALVNSTNTKGTITVGTEFNTISSGQIVTAQIPITVSLGDASKAVTSNVIATQKVYASAVPRVTFDGGSSSTSDFGVVHVGDVVSATGTITNSATAALADSLFVNPNFTVGSFSTKGVQTYLAPGTSETFTASLDTSQSGPFSKALSSGLITVAGHDPDLSDEALTVSGLLTATVNSYAQPVVTTSSSVGTLIQKGLSWSLNLGDISKNSSIQDFSVFVQNIDQNYRDTLAGSFDVSGGGFSISGAGVFSFSGGFSVSVDTKTVGQHTETVTLHPLSQNYTGFSASLPDQTITIIDNVLCYVSGTSIATPHGETHIETVTVGDVVNTHISGQAAVTGINHRHVDCRSHPDPKKVWPVRVSAGAFGEDMPRRDLWLSPDHAVFVDGVLIPIKHLINGTSIAQVPMDEVTYYHIELPQHDVLLAEGLPAKSYLDIGDRSNFSNGGNVVRLHPDFSTRAADVAGIWETKACAPLVVTGHQLVTVRKRLEERARLICVKARQAAGTKHRNMIGSDLNSLPARRHA